MHRALFAQYREFSGLIWGRGDARGAREPRACRTLPRPASSPTSPQRGSKSYMKRESYYNLSSDEVHYTACSLLVILKNSCSKTPGAERQFRCRANVAHIRQSRPGSGLGFPVQVLKPFQVVPFSLGSGRQGSQWRKGTSTTTAVFRAKCLYIVYRQVF